MTKRYQRGNQEGIDQRRTDNTMTKRYLLLWSMPSWLPLWYLLVIVLSVLLWSMPSWLPLWYLLEEGLTIQWPKDTKGVIKKA
jgi:hypothetical protein